MGIDLINSALFRYLPSSVHIAIDSESPRWSVVRLSDHTGLNLAEFRSGSNILRASNLGRHLMNLGMFTLDGSNDAEALVKVLGERKSVHIELFPDEQSSDWAHYAPKLDALDSLLVDNVFFLR